METGRDGSGGRPPTSFTCHCRPAGGAWRWAGLGPQGRVPGLRWWQRHSNLARDGRGLVGAGRAPLPGLGAWQDPHDVRFLVARHPFQTAAPDRGGGERAPFESVAHVLEGFQIAGGRCPRGCGDKRTSVPSLKSLALIQRLGLTHSKGGEGWAGWSSKEVGCPGGPEFKSPLHHLLPRDWGQAPWPVSSAVDTGLVKA